MTNEELANIEGVKVWIREVSGDWGNARKRISGHYDICPLCHQDITKSGYLVIANNRVFPNTVLCHCVDGNLKNPDLRRIVAENIKRSYEKHAAAMATIERDGWHDQ